MKKDKRKLTIILSILIVMCVGVSYAFWKTISYQEKTTDIFSSCFNLSLTEALNSNIMLENVYPISDEDGLKTKAYEFTLENTCEMPAKTSINLNVLNNTFNLNNIKVALNESNFLPPTILGDLPTLSNDDAVTKQLGEIVLFPHSPITYDFRIWLDENVAYGEEQSKTMTSKIEVTARAYDSAIAGNEFRGQVKDIYKNNTAKTGAGAYLINDPYYGEQYVVKGNVIDNYVWYSGHMWQIVSVDEAGMKLITEDPVIYLESLTGFYQTGDTKKWIENEFVPSLENPDGFLKNRTWYGSKEKFDQWDTAGLKESDEIFEAKASMLTAYEYERSINKEYDVERNTSFLNHGVFNYVTTTTLQNGSRCYPASVTYYDGRGDSSSGIRPVINIKPEIVIKAGDGTLGNPYAFEENKDYSGSSVASRYAGEYIKYSDYLWRITSVDDVGVKLLLMDNIMFYPFGTSTNFEVTSGIGQVLNTSFLSTLNNPSEYLVNAKWIQPLMDLETTSYSELESSVSSDVTFERNAFVGILGPVDQFASDGNRTYLLAVNKNNSLIYNYGVMNATVNRPEITYRMPVSIVLKRSNIIHSGTGREEDPFVIDDSFSKTIVDKTIEEVVKSQPLTTSNNGLYIVNDSIYGQQYTYKGGVFNNYVYYSGKLWQIVKTDSQGTLMILENSITEMEANKKTYMNSEIKKWIENEFYPTLDNTEFFLQSRDWYTSNKTQYLTLQHRGNIGVISYYDYAKSAMYPTNSIGAGNGSYMYRGYNFSINEDVLYNGTRFDEMIGGGIRPAINLKNSIKVISGKGTRNNPYILENEPLANIGDYLNTRLSGEYIKFGNYLWQISTIEEDLTKIVADFSIKNVAYKDASHNLNLNVNTNIGKILNHDLYNYLQHELNAIEARTWYEGLYNIDNYLSVKNASVPGVEFEKKLNIGLLRIGEMYSTVNKYDIFTNYNAYLSFALESGSKKAYTRVYSNLEYSLGRYSFYAKSYRPSLYLKSTVKITGGSGTRNDPYTIGF